MKSDLHERGNQTATLAALYENLDQPPANTPDQTRPASQGQGRKWLGQPGVWLPVEVIVTRCTPFKGKGYHSFIYTMEDRDKNILVWFAPGRPFSIGSRYFIRGLVKEHMTWQNQRQTKLKDVEVIESGWPSEKTSATASASASQYQCSNAAKAKNSQMDLFAGLAALIDPTVNYKKDVLEQLMINIKVSEMCFSQYGFNATFLTDYQAIKSQAVIIAQARPEQAEQIYARLESLTQLVNNSLTNIPL